MFNNLFINTTPINRRKATEAMKAFYRYCKQPEPEVVVVDGPDHLAREIDLEDEGFSFFDHKDIAHFVTSRGVGKQRRISSNIASLFCQYAKPKNMKSGFVGSTAVLIPTDYEYNGDSKWEQLATAVWNESYITVNFKKRSYIIDRPKTVLVNDRGLHCDNGAAIAFRDGSEFFFWNGVSVQRNHLFHPATMTLDDIHKHNSKKHILIALAGVDHYLEMCRAWKPNVDDKFQKFFSFSKMVVSGDELVVKSWDKKGYGHNYIDEPYSVTIANGDINQVCGILMANDVYNDYYHFVGNPFDTDHYGLLFQEHDRELWDLLNIREMMLRGANRIIIQYQKKDGVDVFRLTSGQEIPSCKHDVVPSWFKSKMFLGDNALYENEELGYAVKWEDGKMSFTGDIEFKSGIRKDDGPLVFHNPLFSGYENVPTYNFNLNLTSDSWEGLLEKWSKLAFDWLSMHEDSTRIP